MVTFTLAPAALAGFKPFGERLADGYYPVKITNIEAQEKDGVPTPGNYKLTLSIEGAEVNDWITLPGFVNNARDEADRKKKENINARGIVSILTSLGYAAADIASHAVNQAWFLQAERTGYIGYLSYDEPNAQGGTKMKSEITWFTKEQYDAKIAAGAVPTRRVQTAGGVAGAVPGQGFAPAGAPGAAHAGFQPPPGGFQPAVGGAGFTPPVQGAPPGAATGAPPGFAPSGVPPTNGVPPAGSFQPPTGGFAAPPGVAR